MLKALSVAILWVGLSFHAFSQDDGEDSKVYINSNRKYKNEVAIDISPLQFLLGNAGANYPSLFYRKHFIKTKAVKSLSGVSVTSYHAYRFRIGSNLSFQKLYIPDIRNIIVNSPNYYYYNWGSQQLSNYSSFFIRVGREKQLRSGRFELLYGYDLFYEFTRSEAQNLYISVYNNAAGISNVNQQWGYSEKNSMAGVAAIGGLKYFLIPRLCFSAEATFNFGYTFQSKTTFYAYYDTGIDDYQETNIEGIKMNGLKSTINPLFLINIGYYF